LSLLADMSAGCVNHAAEARMYRRRAQRQVRTQLHELLRRGTSNWPALSVGEVEMLKFREVASAAVVHLRATRACSQTAVALALALTISMLPRMAVAGPIDSLPAGTWYDVPNSRMSTVDPCPAANCSYSGNEGQSGVMNDWSGGAFATGYGTQGGLVIFGGGHNGYLGNEVYVFDVAQLKWVRLTSPLDNPTCNYDEGELQDGSPCAAHTYDYVQYHPKTNSFVELGSTSLENVGGGGSPRVHLLNLATKQWRRGARRANFNDQTGSSTAYDPNRDVFWFLGPFNNYFDSYDPNANGGSGAWTQYQQFNIEIDAVADIDPTRDLYVVVEGRVSHSLYVFDLKNPSQPPVKVQTSGDTTVQNSAGNGFGWDPVAGAFIGWAGGTSVYKLTPPSGDWRTGTWIWTRLDPASGNSANPGAKNPANTYSRWRYVPSVNAWIIANSTSSDVFFYKLSGGAGSGSTTPPPSSPPPAAAPTLTLSASPASVTAGSSSTLSWSATNATSCTASGGWSGTLAVSGSQTTGSLATATNYALACTGAGGSVSKTVSVTVASPSQAAVPTVALAASPTSVQAGGTAMLTWSSTSASSCTASGGWTGSKATSGSQAIGPISANVTYVLSCTGTGGSAQQSAQVTMASSGGSTSGSGSATGSSSPPGSPPVGSAITSITVVNQSTAALTQVPVTFGEVFRDGDIPPGASLSASLADGTRLPLQVDAKTTHADGSLRNAVLSTRVPSLASGSTIQVKLNSAATPLAGSAVQLSELLATSFDAEVDLTLAGTKYSATARSLLQSGANLKQWLSGPLASEWIVGGPVKSSAGTPHPHLTAYFHVRAYRAPGGGVDRVRVDTVVENGWTEVTGPATFNYTAQILVGGQSVYSQTVSHYDHSRWHKQFWWPGAPAIAVEHDTAYLQSTLAVPGYANVKPTDAYLSGLMQSATPMGHGDLTQYFPDTGAQNQIGPLPLWAANYITSGADPRAYRNLLANDDSAGSYSVHYRDETTGYPVSIGDHPTLSLQTDGDLPTVSGSNPNTADNAHQPSIGFLSYLLTGDYYYMEEMQFWSSWDELWMNSDYRQQAKGIFGSQVRAQAWSLRNLAQSAYATPDSHPLKAQLVASVGYNIANYEANYSANSGANKLGAVASYDGYQAFAPWMDDFLTWTLAYVVDLGFDARPIRDWKFMFPIGRMGTTDYCYKEASAYHLQTGTSDTSWYPDFKTLYSANFGANTSCPDGATMDGYPDSPTGYPSNLRPALVAAVEANAPGASTAWSRFLNSAVQPNFTNMPVWALVPRTATAAPPPPTGGTPALSFSINNTSISAGASVTLTWAASNVSSCTASGGWSGAKSPTGSQSVGPVNSNTTFTLTCQGATTTVAKSVSVTLAPASPPTAAPAVSLTANPTSVTSGAASTLQWISTNATSCTASGSWSGTKATSGSQSTGTLAQTASYTLACTGTGGQAQATATVTVQAASSGGGGSSSGGGSTGGSPTLAFTASRTSVVPGGSSRLTWSATTNATCKASGGWSGTKPAQGSQLLRGLTVSSIYSLSCTLNGQSVTKMVQIAVTGSTSAPPPTLTLSASPASLASGQSSVLTWTSTGATACTASGGWTGAKATAGSATVGPLSQSTSYTLSCSGAGGMVQKSVSITVGAPSSSAGLSGSVDSSLIDLQGQNRVYVFAGNVTPHDYRGGAGDPLYSIPVQQDSNACTFHYSLPSLPAGTYTVAFTNQAGQDQTGVTNSIAFSGTTSVTLGSTSSTANFAASRVLTVGPGKQYSTIRQAAAAATAGTVIEVDPGNYPDDIVVWRTNNVTVRGMGSVRPHVYATKVIPYASGNDLQNGKGLWVVDGTGVRIENFELSGAKVTDQNGAGVRGEGRNLTICNSYLHDNEDGFLGEAYGTLTIEYSSFANNGIGDGHTHNVYVDDGGTPDSTLVFRYNDSSHSIIGHMLKTRAPVNYILYNRMMDEADGTSSYNIDVSNGGLVYAIGNVLQQGPNTDNSAIIAYGAEGLLSGRTHALYLVNNTIVNDRGSGQFVTAASGISTFRSINNLFVGSGTLYSGAQPQATTNLSTANPAFVDRGAYDYHLTSQSPGINGGTAPGSANGVDLTPVWEYVDPAGRELRPVNGNLDIGAFEYAP
jgi:hypothetical protein